MGDKAKFEIRRFYPGDPVQVRMNAAAARWTAVMPKVGGAAEEGVIEGDAASGLFVGFLTRAVTAGGEESVLLNSVLPGRLEGDAKVGEVSAAEKAEAFEAEGPDYLTVAADGDADRAIAANTAVGTKCSFLNGKVCKAHDTDTAFFILAQNGLDPVTPNAIRCLFEAIR